MICTNCMKIKRNISDLLQYTPWWQNMSALWTAEICNPLMRWRRVVLISVALNKNLRDTLFSTQKRYSAVNMIGKHNLTLNWRAFHFSSWKKIKTKTNKQWEPTKVAVIDKILENSVLKSYFFRKICGPPNNLQHTKTNESQDWTAKNSNTKPEYWPRSHALRVLLTQFTKESETDN